jgi:hypothetical protein
MSFVDVVAVERFTNGRLGRDDPATLRQLEIALAAVRHWCGWHIAPVQTVELTLDGPGGKLLVLPTLNVRSVTRVTECGEYIDLGDITWSANGRVAKRSAQPWTSEWRGITVEFTHGFDRLPDLEAVVLSSIDRGGFSTVVTGGGGVKVIGPFQYDSGVRVDSGASSEAGPSFTPAERTILDRYRLEKPA